MKFRSIAFLTSVFIFFVTASSASAKYSGGTGEPNDPYKIAAAQDLIDMGFMGDYDKHFVLDANIDLSGYTFNKAVIYNFEGVFDGNDHTIYSLKIEGTKLLGLFGKLSSNAVISNLTLESVDVNGIGDYIGGLVGDNTGTILHSFSFGTVIGNECIGGLAGRNSGTIMYSYSSGVVSGKNYTGGLIGNNSSFINKCYSTCTVEGNDYVGGLMGISSGYTTQSYSTGIVSGNNYIGGLVGRNSNYITLCYSICTINGNNYIGGLAGNNSGYIKQSYNTGIISGNNYTGGLVGENRSLIISCYSTGFINGISNIGGLVGYNCDSPRLGYGTITSCFWDIQTSGTSINDGGTGLTTAQMQVVDNYLNAGWDFTNEQSNGTCNFWYINEGSYPQLTGFSGNTPKELQGSGTTNNPYLIYDANDLGTVWYRPDASYRMEADIDLSGIMWNQAVVPWFDGIFNGNSHTIQSLHIDGIDFLGLFGQLNVNAEISNLTLESVDVNGIGDYVGGMVGYNYRGSIATCYCEGKASGNNDIGGLVGYNGSGSITSCYCMGEVSGDLYIGGLVGYNSGSIISSGSTGDVSGNNNIGGLVGYQEIGNITSSCCTGEVSGDLYIGGLVGYSYGVITSCYNTSTVSGNSCVGGLAGYIRYCSIKSSYSKGTVSGNSYVGGLVGKRYNNTVTSSFWDTQTSGLSTSDGGIAKTTAEMQDINTFLDAGWDFIGETDNGTDDTWWIDEGLDYPRLWWELGPLKYSGGTGEPNDPYKIATAQDLIDLGNEPNDYSKHFIQDANIDLSGYVFDGALIAWDTNSIDYYFNGNAFNGTFDGQGYIINNMHIQGKDYLGMFGYLGPETILSNIALENSDINGVGEFIGSLTGYNNKGRISLCYNNGTVKGNRNVGGLVGRNSGIITLSYSKGPVDGNDIIIGGLVGSNTEGSIVSCYNLGETSGYQLVGGLVGTNSLSYILCSLSAGKVSGEYKIGGLIGENGRSETYYGTVTSSFWNTETSGLSTSDGGTGLTTAQMQDINTYLNADWDFIDEQSNGTNNFWFIEENNYPQLRVFSEHTKYELQGSGTIDEPYLIFDANDLGVIWHNPAAHYSMETDINLSDITWNQAVVPYFEGSFNGNNHIINSLHIEGHNHLGLFGQLKQNADISNLIFESVDVNGTGNYVGSLAGYSYRSNITKCQSNGSIKGNDYVGGLVGSISRDNANKCKSNGTVNGNNYVGGLIGYNFGFISSSLSNSTVMGNESVGGIAGTNSMEISSCYSTGMTIGSNYVGGLVGSNISRISSLNNYSTGLVIGDNNIGGLVGNNKGKMSYASFWDIETSGLSTSDEGTGKTTAEMRDINTFLNAGWDFIGETDNGTEDIWWIDNGLDYPRLWWELETE